MSAFNGSIDDRFEKECPSPCNRWDNDDMQDAWIAGMELAAKKAVNIICTHPSVKGRSLRAVLAEAVMEACKSK